MVAAISVKNVSKRYRSGELANDDVSFEVAQGEIFGLLGVNGAGKSTIVKQIVGLVKPSAGQVFVLGSRVEPGDRYVSQAVGYMPQSVFALNNLTVSEALYYTSHLRGASKREARAQRDRMLETLELSGLASRYAARLSGGQGRLLQLAIALVSQQPILVLDEPTNELDPIKRRLVWDHLRTEAHENGTTILFITHDAVEAERVVDRVGFMRDAKLTLVGRPDELATLAGRPLRVDFVLAPNAPDLSSSFSFARSTMQPDVCTAYVRPDDIRSVIERLPEHCLRSLKITPVTIEELFVDELASDI